MKLSGFTDGLAGCSGSSEGERGSCRRAGFLAEHLVVWLEGRGQAWGGASLAHKRCFGHKEFLIPDMLVETLRQLLIYIYESGAQKRDWGQECVFAEL